MIGNPLEIDAATLQEWLENGHAVEVVDIRPKSDYDVWHVPGSQNVDAYQAIYANSPGPLAGYTAPPNTTVVTVCFVGQTSRVAAQYLQSRGIDAKSLSGGMQAWSLAWNKAEVQLAQSEVQIIQLRRTGKGCLSYLVASQGEAVVIDPSLEPEIYAHLAESHGLRIASVVDTHVHADHLSRSRPLAALTGADYQLPANDRVDFAFQPLQEGDKLAIGNSKIQVISTPGHTFESVSLMLDDEALFTGDTLFLDGVGRPDLKADRAETEQRARILHSTLQHLSSLDPALVILPCHTGRPVAFDGKPVAGTLQSIVASVEALQYGEDEFVSWIFGRIPANPPNYETIVQLNEKGMMPELNPTMLEAGANQCAV